MDAFLLAALTAVAVSLLLLASTLKIEGHKYECSVGGLLRFSIGRQAVALIGLTLSTVLLVLVVLVLVGYMHPREGPVYTMADFFLGRRFGGTVLGFLFGLLFVFWVRQLVLLKEGEAIRWPHRVEAAVLVGLFALGGFSDSLRTIGQRLTGVSAAGISLTFSVLNNRSGGDDRGRQGGSATSAADHKSLTSISFFGRIGDFIDSDVRYVALIKNVAASKPGSGPQGVPDTAMRAEKALFDKTVGPLAKCLGKISMTGDGAEVNDALRKLRPSFREIVGNLGKLSPERVHEAGANFVAVSDAVIEDVGRNYLNSAADPASRNGLAQECADLIKLGCPRAATIGSADSGLAAAIHSCMREKLSDPKKAETNLRIIDIETGLQDVLANPQLFVRPYMRLLYASLLWRLGDYDMAVNQLEVWLNANEAPSSEERIWDTIRVRTSLSVLLEEWIRSTDNPPVLLLEHHLANLDQTTLLLADLPPVMKAWNSFIKPDYDIVKFKFPYPSWGGVCTMSNDDEERRLQLALATTYLQQLMVYTYRAVQHRDYFDRYSPIVTSRRDAMMKVDLTCYQKSAGKDATDLLYAEIMQIYAAVELANAARIYELPDTDSAKTRIENAIWAIRLGKQMIGQQPRIERDKALRSIFNVDQKATELQEELRNLLTRAQEALRQF